jgi:DNA-binding SARP family transcriptional activator
MRSLAGTIDEAGNRSVTIASSPCISQAPPVLYQAVSEIDYRILGALEVTAARLPLELGSGRPRALLGLLLLHRNEVLSSERVVDELWGGRPAPASAAKIVHNGVSRLRRALVSGGAPAGLLGTKGHGYVLHVAPGELDADRFELAVAEGRRALAAGAPERASVGLHDALALWRGPALAEFAFEPFAAADIARLEECRLTAVESRIEADLALGAESTLVGELELLVARHPLRERLRGQLMLALYRSGRQAEALAAFQDARRLLASELGLEPHPTLRRLEHAILSQDPELDPRRAVAPAPAVESRPAVAGAPAVESRPAVAGAPAVESRPAVAPAPAVESPALPAPLVAACRTPLVGRRDLLARLHERAEQARSGDRRAVMLAGEAGIGRTRLAAELAAGLHAAGWTVRYGRADEDGLIPHQPFAEAVGWRDEDAFAALAATLERTARGRPLLLVLDDLQWADRPTLMLLRHLLRSTAGSRLLVLGSYREPVVAAALADLLDDLRREELLDRVPVPALDESGAAELVRRTGAPASPELVRRVHAVAGGNPFLAAELAAAGGHGVPASVLATVGRRVRRLGEPARSVLLVAAVARSELRVDALATRLGRDPDDVLTALERAVEAGLVVEADVDRFAFRHGLIREAIGELASASRRARLAEPGPRWLRAA